MSSPSAALEVDVDADAARARITALLRHWPLPAPFTLVEVFAETAMVGELRLGMVGLVAEGDGRQVTGSAAEHAGLPATRAYCELLERVSLVLARARGGSIPLVATDGVRVGEVDALEVFPDDAAPGHVRASVSNGTALHTQAAEATRRGLDELVERDRVLRAFQGRRAPRRVALAPSSTLDALEDRYALSGHAFDGATFPERRVAAVFGFPRDVDAPLFYGFGAGPTEATALRAAEREALQRLAFLWDEEIPARHPEPTPTPEYHQDYYLCPDRHHILAQWLDGDAAQAATSPAATPVPAPRFADLTPASLGGRVWVVRALCDLLQPLAFGLAPGSSAPHPVV